MGGGIGGGGEGGGLRLTRWAGRLCAPRGRFAVGTAPASGSVDKTEGLD